MSNRHFIGNRAQEVTVGMEWLQISQIKLTAGTKTYYAGDTTGRTFEVECPFGTQDMADNLLTAFDGFVYRPYEARDAMIPVDAELGDAVSVGGVYGGIYKLSLKADALLLADISAPESGDIDHEYPFAGGAVKVDAKNVRHGGSSGTILGDALTPNTVTTTQVDEGINKSLKYANDANSIFSGDASAQWGRFNNLLVGSLFGIGSFAYGAKTIKDGDGNNVVVLARNS